MSGPQQLPRPLEPQGNAITVVVLWIIHSSGYTVGLRKSHVHCVTIITQLRKYLNGSVTSCCRINFVQLGIS